MKAYRKCSNSFNGNHHSLPTLFIVPTTYLPTYLPRRLFAPLWGFKYVDVEIAVLWLSFFPPSFSSRSESSETLFVVPSSRKLTVQTPAAFPTVPLPSDSFLSVCIRLLRKFRPVFVQEQSHMRKIQRLQNSPRIFRDTMRWAHYHFGIWEFRTLIALQF